MDANKGGNLFFQFFSLNFLAKKLFPKTNHIESLFGYYLETLELPP
jgi:hypothetical protein